MTKKIIIKAPLFGDITLNASAPVVNVKEELHKSRQPLRIVKNWDHDTLFARYNTLDEAFDNLHASFRLVEDCLPFGTDHITPRRKKRA